MATTRDGGREIRVREDMKSPWRTLLTVGPDDTVGVLDFTADGKGLILKSTVGRDTAAVIERDIASGGERLARLRQEVS